MWHPACDALCRIYIYMHTFINTHTYIYIFTYMHTYIHKCIDTYMHTCIHNTYIQIGVQISSCKHGIGWSRFSAEGSSVCMYIFTYIYICVCGCIWLEPVFCKRKFGIYVYVCIFLHIYIYIHIYIYTYICIWLESVFCRSKFGMYVYVCMYMFAFGWSLFSAEASLVCMYVYIFTCIYVMEPVFYKRKFGIFFLFMVRVA